ncbi:long-chain fatty acid--CoA ligase [Amnibacterium sp. CER49]|uniref:long-chain-fatty-acid--CoA ligase n=1 Tax=Amnibacterium sp. CER49 TaxID=3039161 RepID=UPI00244D35AE|nr:long-chain fatty acid--CoA ligase [Amnibacterium sp. CER49]MDH2444929.1 long-chain fatty acid--CoA ligase [Amnibacterium sp. CER49]
MNDDVLRSSGNATLSVASILADAAWRYPDATAVIWAGQTGPESRVTYGDLWTQTKAIAGVLRDRGIGPGDRVAMLVPNVPMFPRVYYAVLSLGAVVVPIHLLFKNEEVQHVLRDSGAKLAVIAAPSLGEALPAAAATGVDAISVLLPEATRDLVPIPRLEDLVASGESAPIERHVATNPLAPATLLYTSGTTGTPKGAVASHLAIVENVNVSLLDSFDMHHDDVVFGGLPLFHTFGQTCVLNTAFRRGATIVLLPKFEPVAALNAMVEHRVDIFTAVPTMYVALLQAAAAGAPTPQLRYAISGGAPLPLAVLEAFEETFGASVHEGYGLTETSPVVSFNRVGEEIHPGTIGRRIWGVDVEIADADREDAIVVLPRGEIGELVVRGHNLFTGYLGKPDATAAVVVDGWFRTGDLATMDEDDLITIVDRKKDMILRNGYNVYPTEVENVLVRHEAVQTAAVFGVPHEVHGQEIAAAVVLKQGAQATEQEIIDFVKERIAAYKFPRVVHFVPELPLGPSGKVLKRELTREFSPQS